ncbi:transporter substrate-binding domain-containing protein [Kamptonema animale CS-326]|jgi:polar amino acid transport system substrate-binding protein|nr:transporter substrate-binding domain-containing protein [Kamptonema animale CS-326]
MFNRIFNRLNTRLSLPRLLTKPLTMVVVSLVVIFSIASCSGGSSITSKPVAGDVTSSQAVAAAPSQSTAPGTSTLDKIISAGKVRIAVPQDSPPFGSVGTDMQPQGYDIDVAKMLAESLEVKLELVPVTSTNRIPYLQSDRVDLVISSLGATPERAKSIYFSIAYAPFYSGIYGFPGVNASSYTDLSGKTVGVTQGSLEDIELAKRAPKDIQIKRFEDNSTTASALLAGQIELMATGNTIANKISKDNPDKKIENKFVMKNSPCYIGVRRGDLDLLQWVNVFVTNKRLSGDLSELSKKWFGEPLQLPTF